MCNLVFDGYILCQRGSATRIAIKHNIRCIYYAGMTDELDILTRLPIERGSGSGTQCHITPIQHDTTDTPCDRRPIGGEHSRTGIVRIGNTIDDMDTGSDRIQGHTRYRDTTCTSIAPT